MLTMWEEGGGSEGSWRVGREESQLRMEGRVLVRHVWKSGERGGKAQRERWQEDRSKYVGQGRFCVDDWDEGLPVGATPRSPRTRHTMEAAGGVRVPRPWGRAALARKVVT